MGAILPIEFQEPETYNPESFPEKRFFLILLLVYSALRLSQKVRAGNKVCEYMRRKREEAGMSGEK